MKEPRITGDSESFNANFGDTAQFLGAEFFADAADTIPLPALDLNSQFGFTYVPVTILTGNGPPIGAPEPTSVAVLMVGLMGLGLARRAPRNGRS